MWYEYRPFKLLPLPTIFAVVDLWAVMRWQWQMPSPKRTTTGSHLDAREVVEVGDASKHRK